MVVKKPWYRSLTVLAGIVAFITALLQMAGVDVAPDMATDLEAAVGGVAALIAIYGRFRATKAIE